jgi:alpha-ketoglutarate-dependent taurine dioxygenase
MQIEELSPVVGARIEGFDPRTATTAELKQFQAAFREYHMILIRGVNLQEADCVRLTETIGLAQVRVKTAADTDKTMMISNVHEGGHLPNGELLFHSDGMFLERPLKALSLYALHVPSKGGETLFANAALAYRRLPEKLRDRISTLQGRHVWSYSESGNARPDPDAFTAQTRHAIHPLVWPHPDTGEKVLLASKMFTDLILGVPRNESDELLVEIFERIEDPAVEYKHKWEVCDYLVWDNRILQHARAPFDPKEKRALLRVPIIDSPTPVLS